MASYTSFLLSLCRRQHRHHNIISSSSNGGFLLYYLIRNRSTNAESVEPPELSGKNAYDVLGLSETCSFTEIKASFRKLAKQTHPDLIQSQSSDNSNRFLQILAAYEILSDTEKRAHYDKYLFSQKVIIKKHSRQGSQMYTYESSYETPENQMEVVEWLKWYRYAINDIVSKKRIMDESHEATYFDVLQNDFYSAVNAAYYGPLIQSLDLLPNCFEADVRSIPGTSEILHLVSGRDLFGKVCIAKTILELSHSRYQDARTQIRTYNKHKDHICDAYKDLELHVSGKIVAVAKRVPPKGCTADVSNEECEDHIHVYLNLQDDCNDAFEEDAIENKMFLGSIIGLGTSGEEGACFVYNNCGVKTHTVMIHRTLLVKHMHWYQLGDKVSVCECRCTRARLPPSKYWLFEPRCGLHDIGGWYVETYGKDNKGKTVLSQRFWDGVDFSQPSERRVHPAMYLLALAYRTLDIEDTKRNKQTVRDIVEGKMSEVYNWYKKLM